jgi:hypothetical protein
MISVKGAPEKRKKLNGQDESNSKHGRVIHRRGLG